MKTRLPAAALVSSRACQPSATLLVSAVLWALAAATPTYAEDAAPKQTVDKIEVNGHYDNGVGTSDAASQGTVTAKLLENRATLRPGEVLEFVPGLVVTQHSGEGKANQYFLRGFNLDHGTDFATFVAGMPINARTHAHGQGYLDLNFLIPELVERIDYKKGTYYADEGDFASAGAAHISLYNELKQGIASLTIGQHQFTRGLFASSSQFGAGTLLYGLELTHDNNSYELPENVRKQSGALRYSQGGRDNNFSVTALAYNNKWTANDQLPQRAVDQGLIGRFGALDPSDGGETSRYSLSFDWKRRNENSLTQFNAYAVQSKLNLFSNFTYFSEHPFDLGDPINGDQFEQAERRRTTGFDLSQSWFSKLAELDTINKIGVQTRFDKLDPVGLYSTVKRQRAATISESNVKEGGVSVYAENTLQWLEKFRTIVGIRADRFNFDVVSNLPENSGKVHDTITSPKLSMIFGPWANTEFFVNWGEGFHSNDARGTTVTLTPKERLPAEPVTPLVKSRGSELGLRTQVISGLESSLAVWRLRLGSELVFSGDAGDTAPSRPSYRRGVEWNNHYIAAPWLLFDLDLALSRTRFTQDDPVGNYVPGSVEKVASFGVAVTELGPWFGDFHIRYFGPRTLIEDNSQRSRATTVASLRAGYKIDRDWKLSVDVFNFFNREANTIDYFYNSRLRGEPQAGVDDIHFHALEPRQFRVTLSAKF